MKYILLSILLLFCWIYLTVNLVFERLFKTLIIVMLIIWNFKLKKEWLEMYSTYAILFSPDPNLYTEVKTLSDYFNIKKHFIEYTKAHKPTPYHDCPEPKIDHMHHD